MSGHVPGRLDDTQRTIEFAIGKRVGDPRLNARQKLQAFLFPFMRLMFLVRWLLQERDAALTRGEWRPVFSFRSRASAEPT